MNNGYYFYIIVLVKMNLPNKLTTLRLLLAPFFFVFFSYCSNWGKIVCLFLFSISELSDTFDGIIARRNRQLTDFGKLFDPFADKIARFTYFITFLQLNYYPIWMLLIIFYREFYVSILRQIAAEKKIIISARLSGKLKSGIQGIGVLFILISININILYDLKLPEAVITYWAMFFITIVTLLSGFDYLIKFRYLLKIPDK